jgi:hypothetical protein
VCLALRKGNHERRKQKKDAGLKPGATKGELDWLRLMARTDRAGRRHSGRSKQRPYGIWYGKTRLVVESGSKLPHSTEPW